MAINLGAMIQAARSQRNPSGEFISNMQDQQLLGKLLNKGNGQAQAQPDAQAQGGVQGTGYGDKLQMWIEQALRRG